MIGDDGRYDLIETIMNDGIKSELLIRNTERRDGGLYTCLGSNSFGHDDTNIQLIVQGTLGFLSKIFAFVIVYVDSFFSLSSQSLLIHRVISKYLIVMVVPSESFGPILTVGIVL